MTPNEKVSKTPGQIAEELKAILANHSPSSEATLTPNEKVSKTPEQIAEELKAMEAKNQEKVEAAETTLEAVENKIKRDMLGIDLPFDPNDFIVKGVISKKGIKLPGYEYYLDMHSASKEERLMADTIVQQVMGDMPLGKPYYDALETALLAVSITRINKETYEVPNFDSRKTPEFKNLYNQKVELFKTLLKFPSVIIAGITMIYENLEYADVINEKTGELEKQHVSVVTDVKKNS